MSDPRDDLDIPGLADAWPPSPAPAPDFHQRLIRRLHAEAARRQRARVARLMRLYWLASAAAALFILYRLPQGSAPLGTVLTALALLAPVLLLLPRSRDRSLGELFLTTIED